MRTSRSKRGLTLIELLVVVSILTLLIQLLLPAIQAARETGRRSGCVNNLRQIGLAMQSHEASLGYLPTAGWGWAWIGDPNRGSGEAQPGSWAYQLLPYMDQDLIHGMGAGEFGFAKYDALTQLASTPSSVFYCPARRPPLPTPTVDSRITLPELPAGFYWYNAMRPANLARTDYSANVGDRFVFWSEGPPPSKADKGQGFLVFNIGTTNVPSTEVTGVVIQRRPILTRQISDGLTKTYFAGEKFLPFDEYHTGASPADDQSCWNGDDLDTVASTEEKPQLDGRYQSPIGIFGSAHPCGVNMVTCGASVHFISYQVNADVHRYLGNRQDGQTALTSGL